jgi:Polyketide cyclase / dehydrase and lipid transport
VVTIVPASPGDTSPRAARFRRSGGGKARETATKEVRVATVEESIVVDVPLRTTYNQWTQFEEFPKFMEGVESVKISALHSDSRRVKGDLERFKKFIEARQGETGAWRGEVREGVAPERHL